MPVSLSNIPQGSLVHKFIVAGKPGKCKLCHTLVDKLEAHHLSYDPEIVIKICHNCHHKVHFWPQRLNENEIYLLLEKKLSPSAATKIINKKILTPAVLSKLVAPSRKVFLKKEFKTPAPVFDFEARRKKFYSHPKQKIDMRSFNEGKPVKPEKEKIYKPANLDFVKRIKAPKPDKAHV